MKLIFCSSVYHMADYEHLSQRSKVPMSLADHNLNSNLILGLDEVLGTPVTLVNNVQISNYPHYPKILFRKQRWSHTAGAEDCNCGFINLPVVKHLSRACTTLAGVKAEIRKAGTEPICVMTYDLHWGICAGILWAKKRNPQIKTCVVLPDIPGALVCANGGGAVTWLNRFRAALKMRFINRFDSYVFLTKYMAEPVDVSRKSYVVVEGIYNHHQPPLPKATTNQKVIFYSGQLNPVYGLNNLIEAFLEISKDDPTYELWLCGGGFMAEHIQQLAKAQPAIKYYGYVNATAIREYQSQATVLVNPRQNIGDFTKYSFPSKTMEYLASGRPVVGYRLDGFPPEYDAHIQYVEDNSVQALKSKLLEVCSLPQAVRDEIGQNSRDFILKQKNPKAQCAKIVEMIDML